MTRDPLTLAARLEQNVRLCCGDRDAEHYCDGCTDELEAATTIRALVEECDELRKWVQVLEDDMNPQDVAELYARVRGEEAKG